MNRITEGVENSGDISSDIIVYRPQVRGWHHQVLGKCTVTTTADADGFSTKMTFTGAAITALTTGNMTFGGHAVAHSVTAYTRAEFHDLADELVTDNPRGLDITLRPVVPVVNVRISATYTGFMNPDQHFIGAGTWLWNPLKPDTGLCS
jgi:hypothetical protein